MTHSSGHRATTQVNGDEIDLVIQEPSLFMSSAHKLLDRREKNSSKNRLVFYVQMPIAPCFNALMLCRILNYL